MNAASVFSLGISITAAEATNHFALSLSAKMAVTINIFRGAPRSDYHLMQKYPLLRGQFLTTKTSMVFFQLMTLRHEVEDPPVSTWFTQRHQESANLRIAPKSRHCIHRHPPSFAPPRFTLASRRYLQRPGLSLSLLLFIATQYAEVTL